MKKSILINKLKEILRLNLIAFKINQYYKLNVYMLCFLFICIIASIIMRTNLIQKDILVTYLQLQDQFIILFLYLLALLTIFYAFKLILDIMIRCVQALKIIPEFINLYKSNELNMTTIISLYYLQHIFFMIISSWILYNIMIKLNIFIDNIYIISLGIILSILFIHYYPLKGFNVDTNMKGYPIWVYLCLLLFAVFYILMLPFIVINVIHSDKLIEFKDNFIKYFIINDSINYMNSNTNNDNNNNTNSIVRIARNTIELRGNTVEIEDNIIRTGTNIVNHNYDIDTVNIHQQSTSDSSQRQQSQSIGNILASQQSNSQNQPNFTSSTSHSNSSTSQYPHIKSEDIIFGGLTDYINNQNKSSNELFKGLFTLPNNCKNINSSDIINNVNIQVENLKIINNNCELDNMITLNYLRIERYTYDIELVNYLLNSILNLNVLENNEVKSIIENNVDNSSLIINNNNSSQINLINNDNNVNVKVNIKNIVYTGLRRIKSMITLNNQSKIDFSLSSNPYKFSISFYDVLLNNTNDIMKYILNDSRINIKTKDHLLNLSQQLKIRIESNRQIQHVLENIIINKDNIYNNNYKQLKFIIQEYLINRELSNDKNYILDHRGEFINALVKILNINNSNLHLNFYSLYEFYLLNDWDYLLYKNNKHSSKGMTELIHPELNHYLITLHHKFHELIMKYVHHDITKDEIFKLFNSFNNQFKTFMDAYDKSTFKLFNLKIENNPNINNILIENITKSRELDYFYNIFKDKNK